MIWENKSTQLISGYCRVRVQPPTGNIYWVTFAPAMYTLKKSLGQHFLRDENVSRKIVSALRQHRFRRLLEVGPGGGALTKYLLDLEAIDFRAVEIDPEKVRFLQHTFPALQDKLIEDSFLEMDKPFDDRFAIVGNFPYNISSQILFKILEWKDDIDCVICMLQKEVAERIAAPPGNKIYGVTSVLVQAFFDVDYLFEVHEQSFTPPPAVKGAVLQLQPVRMRTSFRSEKDFFKLVKTAFNQRRKKLRNAVRGLFDELILQEEIFSKRAEQLSVSDFAGLTFRMK
jgi:16S rRNA (adenine1518-N6/adenine1519-N6)-dimethyltransferase